MTQIVFGQLRFPSPTLTRWLPQMQHVLVGIFICFVSTTAATAPAADQSDFESPTAAVKALKTALEKDSGTEILKIFGRQYKDELIGGDAIASRHDRQQLFSAIQETWKLRDDGDGQNILIIGNNAWPFPFPLVKSGVRWHFDTASGIEEVVQRRTGENELTAIEMCKLYIGRAT